MNEQRNVVSQEQGTQTDWPRILPSRLYGLRVKYGLKFISSLLLPLVLGVFTFVITMEQQNSSRQQRNEDRNASQMHREQEKSLDEDRYKNEVVDTYIREMAILLKEDSSGSLTYDEVTATVARAKTLNIFRKLDSQRNARIIRFLHEAKQLYDTETRRSLDLSTAKLHNIDFHDLAINEKYLHNLKLTDIFLSNATFVSIQVEHVNFTNTQFDNVNFSFSDLNNVNFTDTRFDNINFAYARLVNVSFSSAKLYNINFAFTRLYNVDFKFATLDNIDFSSAQLHNVSFSEAELNRVNFSSFTPRIVDFTFTRLKNIDFSAAYLAGVDFSSSLLFNCWFIQATLTKIVVNSARFDSVIFVSSLFHKVSFPNSSFFNTDLSSTKFIETEFSSTQFDNTNVSLARFEQTTFISAELHKVSFSSAEFKEVSFSQTILDSVTFSNAIISDTDFQRVISLKANFSFTNISYSTFINTDIQGASFVGSNLKNVNFSQANLQRVNLIDAKITESQLESALSVQDALLPNGTLARGNNLLNKGQTGCNISFGNGWILHKGNVTAKISSADSNNCYFLLQSHNTGATISKRVDLSNVWDSESWPHSLAVLSANMSLGVSIQLRIIKNTKNTNAHLRLNSTKRNISLALDYDTRELEVLVEFNALNRQNSVTNYWCDDIKLFIIYGAYLEFLKVIPRIPLNARWEQIGMRVAGGNEKGSGINQLHEPYGISIIQDETMIIAERENDRVVQWRMAATNGQLLAGGNGAGSRLDQLNRPSDVVFDKMTDSLIICSRNSRQVVRWPRHKGTTQGECLINNIRCYGLDMDDQAFLYISDIGNHSVKRYRMQDMTETIVAGGHGKGNDSRTLNIPTFIFVDRQQTVYVSDSQNHRVMKWPKDAMEGIVVAGGNGEGNTLKQLSYPNGLFVDTFDTVYVADMGNNRVMRWPNGSAEGTIIVGGSGQGSETNQLYSPVGLTFDRHGNLYVADNGNHRVQRYSIE